MKSVEEINAGYRAAGWGTVAEFFGHQPYYVDDKAVGVYEEIYEALADHVKLGQLREAVIGKRRREVLIAGGLVGVEEITGMRDNLIQLRDEALKQGDMEWAVLLSHVIHLLLVTKYIFDGDPVLLNGRQTYQEVTE